ncbi:3-dehydroquinate synthase [Fulvivirga sedimenti]|uniref:3-dehydroquinate synthase n=1 Tax=Fulvivirga sedimenti TaxID=2879465 RepID=A0A9X1HLN9_9BACT|nr:3-dehydroquinate synthase [Fulvivirga sedimenti]
MKEIFIKQRFEVPFRYNVYFKRDLFEESNDFLRKLLESEGASRLAVVIDGGLAQAQPDLRSRIDRYFKGSFTAACIEVQGGEAVKNSWEGVEAVLKLVNEQHIDRHSYVIAIGGGAVLDMAGFAAAIAHRGVRHIRIPTTVLSQNDSGVGVKNGINYFGKKNFIGTFAPPNVVINDVTFLETLNDRDWRSGISEAIKVSLLKDPDFFEWIEENVHALNARNADVMEELIYRCAELHVEHISGQGDPFESGSSRPLDFGHWAAHKLEHVTDYTVRHGEAVAMGIALDVCYAGEIGMLSQALTDRIVRLISSLGFAVYHTDLGDENGMNPEIMHGLVEFQEHLGGVLTITLIEDVGKAVDVHEVDHDAYDRSIKKLKNRS